MKTARLLTQRIGFALCRSWNIEVERSAQASCVGRGVGVAYENTATYITSWMGPPTQNFQTQACLAQKKDAPPGHEKDPHMAEPVSPGDTADVAPGYFREKDDDAPYIETPPIPGPEKTSGGTATPASERSGHGFEEPAVAKPPRPPTREELKQKPDVPDFTGAGAANPQDDAARREGGPSVGVEYAEYATGYHAEEHPAGHSGVKDHDDTRAAGMPLPMSATKAQQGDIGAEPEPLRPLDRPLGTKPAESMSPETERELGVDNVRLGERPKDPRDDRTEQPR